MLQQSARRRLELFDVPKSFIARLEKTGAIQRNVTLNAPVSGFVTAKDIFEGQKLEPGMEVCHLVPHGADRLPGDLQTLEETRARPDGCPLPAAVP